MVIEEDIWFVEVWGQVEHELLGANLGGELCLEFLGRPHDRGSVGTLDWVAVAVSRHRLAERRYQDEA